MLGIEFNDAKWVCTDMLAHDIQDVISTGYPDLDIITRGGFMRGGLTVIGSEHPMENTVFIKSLLRYMVKGDDCISAMVFSLRTPRKTFIKEMILALSCISSFGEKADINEEDVKKSASLIAESPVKIYDQENIGSFDEIATLAMEHFGNTGLDYVLIDSFEFINVKEDESIELMKKLKRLAVQLNCSVIMTTTDMMPYTRDMMKRQPQMRDFRNNIVRAYADQALILIDGQGLLEEISGYYVQIHVVRGKAMAYTKLVYLRAFGLFASAGE